MGLMDGFFSFAKDMGRRLFDRDEDAADAIKKHIEEDNPGLEKVAVEYSDGVVKIGGDAPTPEAVEKAVLMAGNVKGVTRVDVSGVSAPEQTAEVRFHVVERGDTLSAIARRYYGKASEYHKIFEANREVIKDPDLIFPGQKIRIPM